MSQAVSRTEERREKQQTRERREKQPREEEREREARILERTGGMWGLACVYCHAMAHSYMAGAKG